MSELQQYCSNVNATLWATALAGFQRLIAKRKCEWESEYLF